MSEKCCTFAAMKFFQIFRRKAHQTPRSLRIDGVTTTMTPAPDDAELAALALLDTLASEKGKVNSEKFATAKGKRSKNCQLSAVNCKLPAKPIQGTPEYYRQLGEKITAARAAEARAAMRYVAYCEQQLGKIEELKSSRTEAEGKASNSQPSTVRSQLPTVNDLETGLYRHMDAVEREGGELLRRWQRVLAECIIRQAPPPPDD